MDSCYETRRDGFDGESPRRVVWRVDDVAFWVSVCVAVLGEAVSDREEGSVAARSDVSRILQEENGFFK